MYTRTSTFVVLSAFAATAVLAETHTFTFTNKCDDSKGTPTLFINDQSVSLTSNSYTVNSSVDKFSAFLQDRSGSCGSQGTACPYVSGGLDNQGVSQASIFLLSSIAKYTVPTGFTFQSPGSPTCNNQGQDCTSSKCPEAITDPNPPVPLPPGVMCNASDVGVEIKFCD